MKITFKPFQSPSPFICRTIDIYVTIYSYETKEILWEGYTYEEISQKYLNIDPVEIVLTNNYNNTPQVEIYVTERQAPPNKTPNRQANSR